MKQSRGAPGGSSKLQNSKLMKQLEDYERAHTPQNKRDQSPKKSEELPDNLRKQLERIQKLKSQLKEKKQQKAELEAPPQKSIPPAPDSAKPQPRQPVQIPVRVPSPPVATAVRVPEPPAPQRPPV